MGRGFWLRRRQVSPYRHRIRRLREAAVRRQPTAARRRHRTGEPQCRLWPRDHQVPRGQGHQLDGLVLRSGMGANPDPELGLPTDALGRIRQGGSQWRDQVNAENAWRRGKQGCSKLPIRARCGRDVSPVRLDIPTPGEHPAPHDFVQSCATNCSPTPRSRPGGPAVLAVGCGNFLIRAVF